MQPQETNTHTGRPACISRLGRWAARLELLEAAQGGAVDNLYLHWPRGRVVW